MQTIEIPIGDYDYEKFKQICEHYNCSCEKPKRGDVYFRVSSEDPINFFWLGANLNFKYNSGLAISTSSKILGE